MFFLLCFLLFWADNLHSQNQFNNGNFFEADENNKWGIKSSDGEWILKPQFENKQIKISNNYAIVQYRRRFGIIDENGSWKVNPIYDDIYYNSTFWITSSDRNQGLIFSDFTVVEPKYTQIQFICSDSIATLYIGTKVGFAFTNGKVIEPYLSDFVSFQSGNGHFKFKNEYNKWGLAFNNGMIIEPRYDEILFFNADYSIIAVKNDNSYFFVNTKGDKYSRYKFDKIAFDFDENGFCWVVLDNKYGFMRDDGFLIEPTYDKVGIFKDGKVSAWLYDKEIVTIDKNGEIIERTVLHAGNESNKANTDNKIVLPSENKVSASENINNRQSNTSSQSYSSSDNNTPINNKRETDDIDMNKILLYGILIGILIGVIAFLIYSYSRKCDNCRKWRSMQVMNRRCVGQVATTVKKTEKTKNRDGEVIATREVHVPATKYIYDIYRKCKRCGYEDVVSDYSTVEN